MGSTPIPGSKLESSYSSKIFNVIWALKKQGYSEETIRVTGKLLKGLAKSSNLDRPESVKACIAQKHCSNGYKENLVNAYDHYAKFHGLFWVKPFYRRIERHPKIPTTLQIETIINFASRNYRPILTLAKYGLRPIEISMVRRKDIDLEHRLVHVRTAKKGKARTVKLKPSDLNLVAIYLSMKQYINEDLVFPNNRAITDNYIKIKKHLAEKHKDSSYLTIRLYDLRHYYATMLYHKTKDILYVKEQLGHKRLENTLVYTHLVDFETDEWLCRVTKDIQQAKQLIEQGFEYVCEIDYARLFRKRK